jgi:aspartyl-tRNA(Asn)/glutamyl-tRNA(Gln) amidotransferase subunit A
MARSAEDCALVFAAIVGVDRLDATTRAAPRTARPIPRRIRVGFASADFEELAAVEARPALAAALATLGRLDVELVEASLPLDLPYGACVRTVIGAEMATIFGELIRGPRFEELIDEQQKAGIRLALETPATAYLDAMRARGLIQEAFRDLFRRVDVVVSFGRPRGATAIDEPTLPRPFGASYADQAGGRPHNGGLIPAGNLAGLPALAFPCGFDTGGLPLGLQAVAAPWREALLIELGRRFQAATDWHTRRPPEP